ASLKIVLKKKVIYLFYFFISLNLFCPPHLFSALTPCPMGYSPCLYTKGAYAHCREAKAALKEAAYTNSYAQNTCSTLYALGVINHKVQQQNKRLFFLEQTL